MAADVASSGFADHAILLDSIRSLTLAQAKALIKDLNNEPETICGRLIVSGNKPDLINRLTKALTDRKGQGDIRGYQRFRTLIYRYKSPPIAPPAHRNGYVSTTSTASATSPLLVDCFTDSSAFPFFRSVVVRAQVQVRMAGSVPLVRTRHIRKYQVEHQPTDHQVLLPLLILP